MENIDMSNQSTQRKHSNITLKTLTAYQLMSQRERMCELFQLLDDSERHDRIVNPAAQEKLLQSTRQSLQDLKTDLAQNWSDKRHSFSMFWNPSNVTHGPGESLAESPGENQGHTLDTRADGWRKGVAAQD